MRSSLAWCLEPQWYEPGQRPKAAKPRVSTVHDTFARVRLEAPTLKAQGLTGPQIAERLGVSRDTVYAALRAAGCGRAKVGK